MTLPNTIAELFRNGAAPDAEDVVNLKDIGSFAASVLARYAEQKRRDVGATADSMLESLATARGGLQSAGDWLDGLALGGLLDDSFWQGMSGDRRGHAGYNNIETERGFLQLMEEEGLTPAEAEAEMPQRRGRRTGLVGRRGQAKPVQGKRAPRARTEAATGKPHSFIMNSGDRMVAETLRSLVAGGLPVVDQVLGRSDALPSDARQARRGFSLDGLTVDDRLPALSASLAEASQNRVAPARMGITEPQSVQSDDRRAYAFFDAAESVFLGLDEALTGLGGADVQASAELGATSTPRGAMASSRRSAAERPVSLAAVVPALDERRAVVAPTAVARRASLARARGVAIEAQKAAQAPGAVGQARMSAVGQAGALRLGAEKFALDLVHRADGAVVPRESRSLVGGVESRVSAAGASPAARTKSPLGAGFTGYESFAVQQIVERGLAVENSILPPFEGAATDRPGSARHVIGAAGRDAAREAAVAGWVDSAVDGAVWLSIAQNETAVSADAAIGQSSSRAMGLAAVSEGRNTVQAPAAMAANGLLAAANQRRNTVQAPGAMAASGLPAKSDSGRVMSVARLLREGTVQLPRVAAPSTRSSGRSSAVVEAGRGMHAAQAIVRAASQGQASATPTRAFAGVTEAMAPRAAAAGPLGRAGAAFGAIRNALLRPVPTAREALLVQGVADFGAAAPFAGVVGEPLGRAFASASRGSSLADRVAPKLGLGETRGLADRADRVGTQEPAFGGRVGAMREMLMNSGWSQPELGLLMQDSGPEIRDELSAATPTTRTGRSPATRAPADRMARNLARVIAGALPVGASVDSAVSGAASANAAARQQASTYLGLLSGRGADAYFGNAAPAAGLAAKNAARAPERAVLNALGELGQMASGDVMRADNPVPVGVRRQVVANIRASESSVRAADLGRRDANLRQSALSELVAGGYLPQSFVDREASGVYLSLAEIEQGLAASSSLPASGRAQLIAQLGRIPGAATMGVAPATFGATFAGFASTTGLLADRGMGASLSGEGVSLRALADRGIVDGRLADRAASTEFLSIAEVEASFETSSLAPEARRRVVDAVRAASGGAAQIDVASFRRVMASEVVGTRGVATPGLPGVARLDMLAGSADLGTAGIRQPATGLQAMADRGVVPSRLAEMARSGDFLSLDVVESSLSESTLAPAARQRVLDIVRSSAGSDGGVQRAQLERALAGELAVAPATAGSAIGAVPFVPRNALAGADTANATLSVTPTGGVVALADQGLIPMALADRAMLGEFVSVAEVERALADRSVTAEVRRRAMETLSASKGASPQMREPTNAFAQAAPALDAGPASKPLGVSASRAWLEARTASLLEAGVSAASSVGGATTFADLTVPGSPGRAPSVANLSMAAPEMAFLAGDSSESVASGGVGARLADAMSLASAGPAGASRLVGLPAQTKSLTSRAPAGPAGLGAPLGPDVRTTASTAAPLSYAAGWKASSAASTEERMRSLPVGLDRVLAPEVMLSGMRSIELNKAVREMSIRGAAGFESLGVLTTLADSGVDIGAGRSALGRESASTGAADASTLRAQQLLDRVQRAGGAAASTALNEILLKGADPVEAVSRARLSKRERAGLLSSILRGAERAETASIFEGAGGADFAFEWLGRVDGSRSGVEYIASLKNNFK